MVRKFLCVCSLTTVAFVMPAEVNADGVLDYLFGKPTLTEEWTYQSGVFDESAAEICAYDKKTKRVFVTNSNSKTVDVLDAVTGDLEEQIYLDSAPTSVAAYKGLVAIAVPADTGIRGAVHFVNAENLSEKSVVEVGYLPDMLTFSPNGKYVVVANEGEPTSDYSLDPKGSVSVIKVNRGKKTTVNEAGFESFNSQKDALVASGVRIFGPGASVAQDLEPEYVTVTPNSKFAYVTLQENNAIAIVDLQKATVLSIKPLGFKNHALSGNGLDASDKDDSINIQNWPIFGMYQPDAIGVVSYFGFDFVITANEGDARDYDTFSEEERIKDLTLSPLAFPNAEDLQSNQQMGRLNVTSTLGSNEEGEYEALYSFGSRSFSIWAARPNGYLTQVFDSGDQFELITAEQLPENFNSTNDENDTFDNRSDNKGPEPEGLTIGSDLFQTYSFIGLERVGGIMTYEITNPFSPTFIEYSNNRDFSVAADSPAAGDLGPEGLSFVSRSDSPFKEPALIVSNEISGTTTLYRLKRVGGILSHLFND